MFSLVLHVYEPRPSVHLDGSVLKQGDVTEGLLSRIYTYKFSWWINYVVSKQMILSFLSFLLLSSKCVTNGLTIMDNKHILKE